jgi:hypothetical protein
MIPDKEDGTHGFTEYVSASLFPTSVCMVPASIYTLMHASVRAKCMESLETHAFVVHERVSHNVKSSKNCLDMTEEPTCTESDDHKMMMMSKRKYDDIHI